MEVLKIRFVTALRKEAGACRPGEDDAIILSKGKKSGGMHVITSQLLIAAVMPTACLHVYLLTILGPYDAAGTRVRGRHADYFSLEHLGHVYKHL